MKDPRKAESDCRRFMSSGKTVGARVSGVVVLAESVTVIPEISTAADRIAMVLSDTAGLEVTVINRLPVCPPPPQFVTQPPPLRPLQEETANAASKSTKRKDLL